MTIRAPRPLRHAATPTPPNLQLMYAASMPSNDPILLAAQHWLPQKHNIRPLSRSARDGSRSPKKSVSVDQQRRARSRSFRMVNRIAGLEYQSSHGSISTKTSKTEMLQTLPAYSQTSSSGRSAGPSSLTYVNDPASPPPPPYPVPHHNDDDGGKDANDYGTVGGVVARPTRTPISQNTSPPPAGTPPHPPSSRLGAAPPGAGSRTGSMGMGTARSRSESFRTAPENPWSSVEDHLGGGVGLGLSLGGLGDDAKAQAPSAKTSQSTVRAPEAHFSRSPDVAVEIEVEAEAEVEAEPEPVERTLCANTAPTPQAQQTPVPGDAGPEQAAEPPSNPSVAVELKREGQCSTPNVKEAVADFSDSDADVEREWDDNLGRTVVVRKRRLVETEPKSLCSSSPPRTNSRPQKPRHGGPEVIEDASFVPAPKAAQALRGLDLQEKKVDTPTSPRNFSRPTNSQTSVATEVRRFSGISTHSTTSTAVEASIPDALPRRGRTLRHVRKIGSLRDSGSDRSAIGSVVGSVVTTAPSNSEGKSRGGGGGGESEHSSLRSRVVNRSEAWRSQSVVSNTSIPSRSARKEIWRNGAIPVVVVPGRRSSSGHPGGDEKVLLRSSSKKSQRSNSVRSRPQQDSERAAHRPDPPPMEGASFRSRRMSATDRSPRTIDFPPAIPRRSSSLSAPTSRNGSRSGSMKAPSQTTRNALQIDLTQALVDKMASRQEKSEQVAETVLVAPAPELVSSVDAAAPPASVPAPTIIVPAPAPASEPEPPVLASPVGRRFSFERNPEVLSSRRLSAHNPPISMVSVETVATHLTSATSNAEVSQATAVSIYPHQNSSVLVVGHTRLSDESQSASKDHAPAVPAAVPAMMYTRPKEAGRFATPPPRRLSLGAIDSPLRNPRAPPQPPARPPALVLALATPSGSTPTREQRDTMGNGSYFDVTDRAPADVFDGSGGSQSPVRRALSLTRKTESGNPPRATRSSLLRTFSLSRTLRRHRSSGGKDKDRAREAHEEPPADMIVYPTDDGWPQPNDDKPRPLDEPPRYGSDYPDYDGGERARTHQVRFRLPPPPPPKRSLSARIKKAFLPRVDKDGEASRSSARHERHQPEDSGRRPGTRAGPLERGFGGSDDVGDGDGGDGGDYDGDCGRDSSDGSKEAFEKCEAKQQPGLEQELAKDTEPERREIRRTRSGNLRVVPYDPGLRSPLRPQFLPFVEAGAYSSSFRRRQQSVGEACDDGGQPQSVSKRYPPLSGNYGGSIFPIEPLQGLSRRISERRRERRSQELRRKISGPSEFRDPVQEVLQLHRLGRHHERRLEHSSSPHQKQQYDPRFVVGAAL